MDAKLKSVIQPTAGTLVPFRRKSRNGRRANVPRRQLPKPTPGGASISRPHPLRAILLARVSTKHTEQDHSPERQLHRLELACVARGWVVVDRVVEKASGTQILNRPPVARALERIVAGDADVLAVDHLSRLGRNARDALEVIDILHAVGAHFFDATHDLDTTKPMGRAMFTIGAAFWELEVADRKEKILEGLERARERGTKLGKPFRSITLEALTRAVEIREENDAAGGRPPSWNEIMRRLEAEGFKKLSRSAISNGVARVIAKRRGAA